MVRLSKRPLNTEVRKEMFESLFRSFARLADENSIGKFLDDLLTPTEKIMVAKRVMSALLLDRGYSYKTISSILKMSLTTINTIHRQLQQRSEGYRLIFQLFPKRKNGSRLITKIERILDALK